MLVHSNTSSTPTPGSSSSTSNTLDATITSSNSSSSQLHYHLQQTSSKLPFQQPQQLVMGSTSALYSRRTSRAPSILNSPTLARVERARLRLEASTPQQTLNDSCASIINALNNEDSLQRVILDPNKQSLLTGRVPVSLMTGPIKRGLLWQQRDRLFSRWKERYFVLTRDYLHCFKRASGSANERASDMGQFIFKVKLVDVEKVEWLNRRSYSSIGLLLGREGRVLLRCDEGLEDWFELLEECSLTSKERRKALKIAQGPRSRASLAAPVSHAFLRNNHFGLGGTYSSALDDWLMTNESATSGLRGQRLVTNSMCASGGTNQILYADSVPDLSVFNNENRNHSGVSTNHSTPQKMSYSSSNNTGRCANKFTSQNKFFSNCNGLYDSPRQTLVNKSFGSTHTVDEENQNGEVELRRPRILRHLSTENGNELDRDCLYRKPKPPTDTRHSAQPMLPTYNNSALNKLISDLDCSAYDSELNTPLSTHRPSSYRENMCNKYNAEILSRNSTETFPSSSLSTVLNSSGSIRAKQLLNSNQTYSPDTLQFSSPQRVSKIRNEEFNSSMKSTNRLNHNDLYNLNQHHYCKSDNQSVDTTSRQTTNGNDNGNTANYSYRANNGNVQNGAVIFGERYQHPSLVAIINEAQGIKFRDRSLSDCQQMSPRGSVNNNPSPSTNRRNHLNPIFNTKTRV